MLYQQTVWPYSARKACKAQGYYEGTSLGHYVDRGRGMIYKDKEYKVPTNIDYEMLAGPPLPYTQDKHKNIGCTEIEHCSDCVLYYSSSTNMCSFSNGKFLVILDRLVEYNVISKGEALDLMLKGEWNGME